MTWRGIDKSLLLGYSNTQCVLPLTKATQTLALVAHTHTHLSFLFFPTHKHTRAFECGARCLVPPYGRVGHPLVVNPGATALRSSGYGSALFNEHKFFDLPKVTTSWKTTPSTQIHTHSHAQYTTQQTTKLHKPQLTCTHTLNSEFLHRSLLPYA